MVSIGLMKHSVKFEKNQPTDTDTGGQIDNYVELLTTKGHMERMGGSRSQEEGDLMLSTTWKLTCRFQTALLNQLNTSVRVVYDNRFFTVHSFQLVNERRFYYQFVLKEQSR